jgi:hypothetical protein
MNKDQYESNRMVQNKRIHLAVFGIGKYNVSCQQAFWWLFFVMPETMAANMSAVQTRVFSRKSTL